MKKRVRIYKAGGSTGQYINRTSQFLQKAQDGMELRSEQMSDVNDIHERVLQYIEKLLLDGQLNTDDIATNILNQNLGYDAKTVEAMISDVQEKMMMQQQQMMQQEQMNQNMNQIAAEEADSEYVDEQPVMKYGGKKLSKSKFVKDYLKKAQEGMEQNEEVVSSTNDLPQDGREALSNNFIKGIQNSVLTNKAEQEYNMMQKGGEEDWASTMHNYGEALDHMMPQDTVTETGIPMARRGRQMRNDMRKIDKDFRRMFGRMPLGFAHPGAMMPYGVSVINPLMAGSMNIPADKTTGNESGEMIDLPNMKIRAKRGWLGRLKEWEADINFGSLPVNYMAGMFGGYGIPYNTGYSRLAQTYSPGRIITENVAKDVNNESIKEIVWNTDSEAANNAANNTSSSSSSQSSGSNSSQSNSSNSSSNSQSSGSQSSGSTIPTEQRVPDLSARIANNDVLNSLKNSGLDFSKDRMVVEQYPMIEAVKKAIADGKSSRDIYSGLLKGGYDPNTASLILGEATDLPHAYWRREFMEGPREPTMAEEQWLRPQSIQAYDDFWQMGALPWTIKPGSTAVGFGSKMLGPGQKVIGSGQKMLNPGQKLINAPYGTQFSLFQGGGELENLMRQRAELIKKRNAASFGSKEYLSLTEQINTLNTQIEIQEAVKQAPQDLDALRVSNPYDPAMQWTTLPGQIGTGRGAYKVQGPVGFWEGLANRLGIWYQDGGQISPEDMDYGNPDLYKFLYGGDEDFTDYKDVTDPYLPQAQTGLSFADYKKQIGDKLQMSLRDDLSAEDVYKLAQQAGVNQNQNQNTSRNSQGFQPGQYYPGMMGGFDPRMMAGMMGGRRPNIGGMMLGSMTGMPFGMLGARRPGLYNRDFNYWTQTGVPTIGGQPYMGQIDPSKISRIHTEGKGRGLFRRPSSSMDIYFNTPAGSNRPKVYFDADGKMRSTEAGVDLSGSGESSSDFDKIVARETKGMTPGSRDYNRTVKNIKRARRKNMLDEFQEDDGVNNVSSTQDSNLQTDNNQTQDQTQTQTQTSRMSPTGGSGMGAMERMDREFNTAMGATQGPLSRQNTPYAPKAYDFNAPPSDPEAFDEWLRNSNTPVNATTPTSSNNLLATPTNTPSVSPTGGSGLGAMQRMDGDMNKAMNTRITRSYSPTLYARPNQQPLGEVPSDPSQFDAYLNNSTMAYGGYVPDYMAYGGLMQAEEGFQTGMKCPPGAMKDPVTGFCKDMATGKMVQPISNLNLPTTESLTKNPFANTQEDPYTNPLTGETAAITNTNDGYKYTGEDLVETGLPDEEVKVSYKGNTAGTLNTDSLASGIFNVGMPIASNLKTMYDNQRTAMSKFGAPQTRVDQRDKRGMYSGLTGRDATRLNEEGSMIVGQNAMYGGSKYRQGGVYNMSKEDLMAFMAAGGEIEFL